MRCACASRAAEQTLNNAIYRYGGIAMHCPKCKNPISPLKVWLITRWSPLRCDRCGASLTRPIDRQFFIMGVLLFTGIFLFIQTPLFLIVWIIVVMLIDAYTVRLVLDQERPPQ